MKPLCHANTPAFRKNNERRETIAVLFMNAAGMPRLTCTGFPYAFLLNKAISPTGGIRFSEALTGCSQTTKERNNNRACFPYPLFRQAASVLNPFICFFFGTLLFLMTNTASAAVTGNGGLTVELDPSGKIIACRWPRPSHFSHIPLAEDEMAPPGLQWAVRCAEQVTLLSREPWRTEAPAYRQNASPIIQTRAILDSSGVDTQQTVFVHPDRDLLAVRLLWTGPPPLEFLWSAAFNPCTRVLPEIPIDASCLVSMNGFAAFWVEETATQYHFRPMAPSSGDWERAGRLVERGGSPGEWKAFGDGVWIGYSSPNPVNGAACLPREEAEALWNGIASGTLNSRNAAIGPSQSVLRVQPVPFGEGFCATLYVAFGRNRDAVDETLSYARNRRFEELEEACAEHWRGWLSKSNLPENTPERQDLIEILLAMDQNTGALTTKDAHTGGRPLATAEGGAWGALALDTLGYHAEADQVLQFLAGTIRETSRRGMPAGSMPAAVYSDGTAALPHLILDASATAWLIGGFWRHGAFLDENGRRAFFDSVWDQTALGAMFLAGWTRDSQGAPFASYHPDRGRDSYSAAYDFTVFMGLVSALNIAEALGRDPEPIWVDRLTELNSLLRFHARNEGIAWELDPAFIEWLRGILPPDDSLWRIEIRKDHGLTPLGEVYVETPHIPPSIPWDSRNAAIRILSRFRNQARN